MPARKKAAKQQTAPATATVTPLPWETPVPQKPYAEISAERRAAWAEHLAQMTVPPELQSWARAMAEKHGATVGTGLLEAGHNLDWLTALLVVRYGEAIHVRDAKTGKDKQFWPDAFTDDDLRRAVRWYTGQDVPGSLRYLDGSSTTQRVITPPAGAAPTLGG